MDLRNIELGLEQFVEKCDSQTLIGSYKQISRKSLYNLLKDKTITRANVLWKMAEYVVATYDTSSSNIDDYINAWKKLASPANNQYLLLEVNPSQWEMYDAQGNKLGDEEYIIEYFSKMKLNSSCPLQQIFYGAPGTGKSHTIDKKTQGHDVIRTTFHPDSDYSTFVGCYKPKMGDSNPLYGFDSKGNTVVAMNSKGKAVEEKKIEYKFVKQAFLKAYIEAWKKMDSHVSSTRGISFSVGTATFTILSVDDTELRQSKTDQINKKAIERVWEKLWDSGSFVIPRGKMSGESVQQAISKWIYDNVEDCKKESFTEGWEKLTDYLKENEIEVKKDSTDRSKKYTLSKSQNNDSVLFSAESHNKKDRIQKCYEGFDEANGVEKGIIDILNKYGADNFDDAWTKLSEDVGNSSLIGDTVAPQFLVIEEINRGNCAQIFGDIFQLLDRQDNGFSEYPIEADTDLQKAIAEELQGVDIKVDWAVKNYKSCVVGATLSDDIRAGRILLLPNNLFIWATMNTSDQSLFPIDSAFKRRWDWKYIKITNAYKKDEKGNFILDAKNEKIPLNWKLSIEHDVVDTTGSKTKEKYDWWLFLQKINDIIASMTSSADKQLGYFFCKAGNDGIISEETFVSKVLFYLWNDVFKDYGFEDVLLFRYKNERGDEEDLTFPDFYDEDGDKVNSERVADFVQKVMDWSKKTE